MLAFSWSGRGGTVPAGVPHSCLQTLELDLLMVEGVLYWMPVTRATSVSSESARPMG